MNGYKMYRPIRLYTVLRRYHKSIRIHCHGLSHINYTDVLIVADFSSFLHCESRNPSWEELLDVESLIHMVYMIIIWLLNAGSQAGVIF